MLIKLFFQIIAGVLGLFIATKIVPDVEFNGFLSSLIITGSILGIVNFFIKPVIKIITFPIRILTFGLFSLAINMVLIWLVVDILSPIEIRGIIPLFWTSIIIWALNLVFEIYASRKKKRQKLKNKII